MPDGISARPRGAAAIALIAFALSGCTAASPTPSPVDAALPNASTLRTIIEAEPEAPVFELVQETTDFDGDPAEVVAYESGGLDVQAVIRRPPSAAVASPAIVLVHGSVDPEEYSGLTDYDDLADLLVDSGYTVVSPDLRSHGDSEDGPSWEVDMDVGATLDVVNAARATAGDPRVDPNRIALFGHSSGGTLVVKSAVVDPQAARAVVAVAPTHVSPWEDVRRFLSGTPSYDTVVAAHGDAEESPDYWREVSALTYVDRMAAPLLVMHGTSDEIVPVGWSRFLEAQWTDAGKAVTLTEVEGGDHWMNGDVDLIAEATTAFLAEKMP
ncbi:alpha/beta hydrolase family protein [Microbacterium sp.]|uniref:alpha/beta hydrolase family protein n=1 Tax=Microbacterium sp. TaxID=51671 RepID=UPI0035B1D49B